MHVAILAPVAWRTPPRHYGPWEQVTSNLAEGLVDAGIEVTLFATRDSLTNGTLDSVIPTGYEEDRTIDAKVAEALHVSNCFEKADKFDIIHNNFDFIPLTYSKHTSTPVLTTIHGFSSPSIIPVYEKYNDVSHYVSISNSDRNSRLNYMATIYHGIDIKHFTFSNSHNNYLVFFGRIHPDKGVHNAIEIARRSGKELVIAGVIQDKNYYRDFVYPYIDDKQIHYIGSVNPTERNKLLGKAQALLHPISFKEPFGLSVIESMACGTPPIAFNKGSMSEIITSGHDGFLVNTVDEAVVKLDSIDSVNRINCRKTVEKRFTSERMIREYISIYNRIIPDYSHL